MRDLYVRNGQGFVLVYSIADQTSFHDLSLMQDIILRIKECKDVTFIVI